MVTPKYVSPILQGYIVIHNTYNMTHFLPQGILRIPKAQQTLVPFFVLSPPF